MVVTTAGRRTAPRSAFPARVCTGFSDGHVLGVADYVDPVASRRAFEAQAVVPPDLLAAAAASAHSREPTRPAGHNETAQAATPITSESHDRPPDAGPVMPNFIDLAGEQGNRLGPVDHSTVSTATSPVGPLQRGNGKPAAISSTRSEHTGSPQASSPRPTSPSTGRINHETTSRLGRTGLKVSPTVSRDHDVRIPMQRSRIRSPSWIPRFDAVASRSSTPRTSTPTGITGELGGETERIIGRWMAGDTRTSRARSSSHPSSLRQWAPIPWDGGGSRKHIMDAIDASLERLQTDYLDLYQIHFWDAQTRHLTRR